MANSTATASTASVQKVLNQQVANWGLLYVKFHNFHFYVKGPEFFTLHIKFEELYTEAGLHFDELAERLLAIDGKPLATMKAFIDESSLKEAKGTESAQQMVETVVNDFTTLINELTEGMEIAEKAGDDTTADMLLSIHASLEKHRWMLKSFLG
jgi:starvation-inducible DNA-binding protein